MEAHHLYAQNREQFITNLLQDKIDPNSQTIGDKESLLHQAVRNYDLPVVELLLSKGAAVVCNGGPYTPLCIAALRGYHDVCLSLVKALSPKDINIWVCSSGGVNSQGYSDKNPIMYAIKNGHVQTVEILMRHNFFDMKRGSVYATEAAYTRNVKLFDTVMKYATPDDSSKSPSLLIRAFQAGVGINISGGHNTSFGHPLPQTKKDYTKKDYSITKTTPYDALLSLMEMCSEEKCRKWYDDHPSEITNFILEIAQKYLQYEDRIRLFGSAIGLGVVTRLLYSLSSLLKKDDLFYDLKKRRKINWIETSYCAESVSHIRHEDLSPQGVHQDILDKAELFVALGRLPTARTFKRLTIYNARDKCEVCFYGIMRIMYLSYYSSSLQDENPEEANYFYQISSKLQIKDINALLKSLTLFDILFFIFKISETRDALS